MGKIDYKSIYETNKVDWKALTDNPQKYEALLAGHYSESNHFVYELLQNAEDESATKVMIEYRKNELRFYHNGKPFDYGDVVGVSSMLMGTKDKNDGQKIGRFGMGFKSVFKYTDEPVIYSDDEAFRIENYLLPVELDEQWDYEKSKTERKVKMADDTWYRPFKDEEHLTKIVIPFRKKKESGDSVRVDGSEVLEKLRTLTGEILLFLTHIREVVWIDMISGEYTRITMSQAEQDAHLFTCRIEGMASSGKEQISRFLKYKRVFDHKEMTNAEVSVAYKLSRTDINAIEGNTPVWVYFPTREMTSLPFLIHGSFETAVSREKLMTPSKFNDTLKLELADLIAESMVDLADRKLITQAFIRNVLMCAFEDEERIGTIPGLKKRVSTAFRTHSLLPDVEKNTYALTELLLPIPHELAGFRNTSVFKNTFQTDRAFVAINNENQKYFSEYFNWLKDDLRIKTFRLSDWARNLTPLENVHVNAATKFEAVDRFYSLLDNHRDGETSSVRMTKNSSYDLEIKKDLPFAWKILRDKPVILNSECRFVPAFVDGEQNVYLGSSSNYKRLNGANIVLNTYAERFVHLFEDAFNITRFDNYQYVKEKVLRKYVNIEKNINFDNEDFEEEHIEDIRQILSLFDEIHDDKVVMDLIQDASIIRTVANEEGTHFFSKPKWVYLQRTDDGMDLRKYFEDIECIVDGQYIELDEVDQEFYEQHGISMSRMKRMGIISTPIIEGERQNLEGKGDGYWKALGDYCPNLYILGLYENIAYIQEDEEEELAKVKSAQILRMLLQNISKIKGTVQKQKLNPRYEVGIAPFIRGKGQIQVNDNTMYWSFNVETGSWVYNKGGELSSPDKMSRYDLNGRIYKEIEADKESFETLGFIKSGDEDKFEALEVISSLERTDKTRLLKKLAKELGYDLNKAEKEKTDSFFDPNSYVEDEFPVRKVRNMDILQRHVKEAFFCADPVRYVKVFRQIRKIKKDSREYALGMYVNSGGFQVCQICRQPKSGKFIEVTEIANFGIEMPQLKLCLCQECSTEYKALRDRDKDKFRKEIDKAFRLINIGDEEEYYELQLPGDMVLHFTETHVAEVKAILELIRENGLPSDNSEDDFEKVIQNAQGNTLNSSLPANVTPVTVITKKDESPEEARDREREEKKKQRRLERERMMQMNIDDFIAQEEKPKDVDSQPVVKVGSKVCFKVVGSNESGVFVNIDPKYPVQKLMIGKKIGDVVKNIKGKKYEITAIL